MNTVVCDIPLNIPDTSVHSGNVQLAGTSFTSAMIVTYDHEGVGSNTPFNLRNTTDPQAFLKAKGQLIGSVSWGLDEDGHVLAPKSIQSHMDELDPVPRKKVKCSLELN